jgi:hypothetical protein
VPLFAYSGYDVMDGAKNVHDQDSDRQDLLEAAAKGVSFLNFLDFKL